MTLKYFCKQFEPLFPKKLNGKSITLVVENESLMNDCKTVKTFSKFFMSILEIL